ncbi:hypothetical protein BDW69DRAFT_180363 [Aspergillus filifer]
MKGEITLDGAIALLSSDKVKDRTDGLADLKHILQQNKRNSKLLSLSDKASHRIFETLFRFISTEKLVYNRASSKAKVTASSRLSACASVIRTAVDTLLSNLRTKSVRAVLDHITDVLVSPGSDLFELLCVYYMKCLSTILHYPAHVEHLSVDEWEGVMHFCLKILNASFDDDSQQTTWSAHSSTLDDYLGASGGRSTPSRMTPGLALREKPKESTSAIEEALLCIRALSGSPNAPIQENAESILLAMANYVRSSRIAGSSHQTAFSTINTVVMRVIFDNAELTRNTLLDLIPAVRHHWATKLLGLRDELLVTTMFVVTTLTNDVQRNPTETLKDAVDGLMDILQREYSRRPEKDVLQVEELSFGSKTQANARRFDLWPRLEIVRSDHNWTIVWVIARLLEKSEALASQLSFTPTEGETPSKRQRIASKIDDVFRDAVSSFGARRLCALQLIPFLPNHYAQIEPKTSLLERLIPSIHDDNTTLSSWTMIAIASIAASPEADVTSLKRYWQQAWDLTMRTSTDRTQTSQIAAFARPLELLNLFMACTNRTFYRPRTPFKGPTGVVAKCWYFHHTNKQIWSYLFDVQEMLDVYDIWNTDATLLMPEFPHLDSNDSSIIDLLQAKSEHFLLSWQSVFEDKSRHVMSDIVQVFTSFCMTVALYLSCLPEQPGSRMQALKSNNNRLWQNICSFFAVREPTSVIPSLLLFPPFLPLDLCFLASKNAVYQALYELVMPLSSILERYRQSSKETLSTMNEDVMDLDDAFLTSTDQFQETSDIMSTQRSDLPLFQDSASFQRYMTILFSMFQRTYSQRNLSQLAHGETLNQYLTSLDEVDILAAHEILPYVHRSCSDLERDSLLELFEDFGAKCLQSYGLERCENSHIVCIRMMDGLARKWTSDIQDDLSDSAADIYHWFTGVFLKKGKTSSSVMIAFAELLGKILSLNPNYLSSQSSQSPRTTLFKLVEEGDVLVKFRASRLIPPLFGQFIFKDHDQIFNDVLECLPRDPEWEEGIAVRLFLLSQLASKWHTLLRRSIYHIFETPAQIRHSLPYAEKCLRHVADALRLQDSREIFRLFSSQILYTWTETQSVLSMPFSIFGYASLEDMLSDVQDEVIGQIMMRASEKDAAEFSKFMDRPFVELLTNSFYKAEAYTISRDISTPPGQGSQPKGVENRLKKILGTEKLVNLAETQFPQIISTFFVTLDLYGQAERAFSKRAGFQGALDTFRRITANESIRVVLPANQQPSFKARYLLDELEFLCRRSGYELETIWTPALASYVCRTLLESIHPALGSLHACSVLRKIKVLLCVAGPVMLSDYPFEMITHGLQPFLVDIFCFDDAQAMVRYLLEAGRPHLVDDPGLMAGIAVSISLSLGRFLESPPASPGLESHLEAVMHKLRSFYSWFQQYVDAYKSPTLDEESSESFRRLTGSLQTLAGQAPGSRDVSESQLLLEVLIDRDSQNGLLNKPISDRVISLLCTTSPTPTDYHLAAIEKDEDAVSTTFTVCETLKDFNTSTEYRSWAARVIGKAFAATGKINDALLREQELALFRPYLSRSNIDPTCRSKANILQLLCNMLLNSEQTGPIERTLQLIVSNLANFPTFGVCASVVPSSLMKALTWEPYQCPGITLSALEARERDGLRGWDLGLSPLDWARNVGLFLSKTAAEDHVIGPLESILYLIPNLATQLLPYILHDALLAEYRGEIHVREDISHIFKTVLQNDEDRTIPHARLVIGCILYLRDQPRPDEQTIVERDSWLDIDYAVASSAASRCRLPKTALLFLELHASRCISSSRRSSVAKYEPPQGLLHDIFKNIDDPDFFYGIQQNSSLESVMETLEHESSGFKNLLFQSAQYDSQLQITGSGTSYGVLKALNSTNLQGISNSMLGSLGNSSDSAIPIDDMLKAATNLRQWDIPVSPLNTSPPATIFRAFQSLNTSGALVDMHASIEDSFANSLNLIDSGRRSAASLRTAMRTLGILTEIEEVLSSKTRDEVDEKWQRMSARSSWLQNTHVQEVGEILSSHETLFSSIKQKDNLKSAFNLTDQDAQLLEVKVIRQSLHIARNHGIPQASLKSAVYLSKLSDQCASLDLNVEGVTKFDLANVLWDQGEMAPSIQILQQLKDRNDLHKQAIPISRAEILVTLGHHIAEARLEKPEAIIQNYLTPAVKELKGRSEAEDAGRVYHGFATFCDQQLQNPDGLEDFNRIEQLRNLKEKEVLSLDAMLKTAEGKERDNLKFHRSKTKQWFDLDDREYQRLKRSREAFLEQCLENYLICLKASEAYNNDVLRFVALWFDQSYLDIANNAVSKYLADVPSRKFAPLMNQLTSRLLDVSDDFQSLLSALIFRICCEHPFHGMYQIFAGSKSRVGKDQSALSRNRAASNLADILRSDKQIGTLWVTVHNANVNYVRFAIERLDDKMKSGAKVPLNKLAPGQRLEQDAVAQRLPPPTMKIDIRVDCDYSDVPKLVRYQSEFTIASGVSAPKIVTAIASNGIRYKQLFKGGNDDLRQDAIMEQVFEQVSSLLKEHQATRQRNLGIRAYKVLPLTSNAGIIEFVPNTIPLNEYLMPAHQKYYPKDMKPNACRKHIADVQTRSFEHRARIYRQVAEHFHPVLRYFFMEKFNNPDDWFGRRLSYTQSTAAISMLGHVLGLGDRHGHNILLDERTGEVVHIDLGVAFEQGRVLPVPEVVPFRLTRDLVDGMGIAKTEGVFRRCCEFTLEALRLESYSIMTILDVLRYDPLYSWTVSPLRMKKMQEQDPGDQPPVLAGSTADQRPTNEPSEADRALTVVAKKLSKTLSVTATVNELIQQATDEKNLAVLYCGWAAYA